MSFLRKVCLVLVIAFVVLIGGVYVFLGLNAKSIFNERVGSLTQRSVDVKAVYPVLPAGMVVEGLDIEGLLKARQVRVDIDLWPLLRREVRFSDVSLEDPVLFLERKDDGAFRSATVPVPAFGAVSSAGAAEKKPRSLVRLTLKKLLVNNGEVRVRDKSGHEFVVEHIRGEMKNVPLSGESVRTDFAVSASMAQLNLPFVGHFVKAKGRLNWVERDLDATAQAVDDDGRIGLDVTAKSFKNDLAVSGRARMTSGQQSQASGQKAGVAEDVVLSVLEAAHADIDMQFSFHTQMDHPRMDKVQLRGNITTGLNSPGSSGNIVAGLKALGGGLLKEERPAEKSSPDAVK